METQTNGDNGHVNVKMETEKEGCSQRARDRKGPGESLPWSFSWSAAPPTP